MFLVLRRSRLSDWSSSADRSVRVNKPWHVVKSQSQLEKLESSIFFSSFSCSCSLPFVESRRTCLLIFSTLHFLQVDGKTVLSLFLFAFHLQEDSDVGTKGILF